MTAPYAVPTGDVGFALSRPQHHIISHKARFKVVIAGRRFGKTHLVVVWLLKIALKYAGCDVWYTAPTQTWARQRSWKRFKKIIPKEYIYKISETFLTIELWNGSVISLLGRDKDPDSLRGDGLRAIALDEFCVQEGDEDGLTTWNDVLRPALADYEGEGMFISTPKGFNWGYDLFEMGMDPDEDEFQSFHYTTLEGGRISEKEILAAKAKTTPRGFRQEWEASFEALAELVYDYYSRDVHVEEFEDAGGTLYCGIDFNVHPMTAIVALKRGQDCDVLDALEIPSSNTDELAKVLKDKYGECDGDGRMRREIICTPDPSGKRRETSAGGKTDFSILRGAGFEIMAPHKAPFVTDRVNNTQAALKTADGQSHLRIHPRATALVKALQGLTYKKGTSIPDPASPHIHITDALGYMLWQQFNRVGYRTVQRTM